MNLRKSIPVALACLLVACGNGSKGERFSGIGQPVASGPKVSATGGLVYDTNGLGLGSNGVPSAAWRNGHHWCEDVDNIATGGAYMVLQTSSGLGQNGGRNGHPGVGLLQTQASATASTRLLGNLALTTLGTNGTSMEFVWSTNILSTSAEEYTIFSGLGHGSALGTAQTDAVGFAYDRLNQGDVLLMEVARSSTRDFKKLDGTGGTVNTPMAVGSIINATGTVFDTRMICTSTRCDAYLGASGGVYTKVGDVCASGCSLAPTVSLTALTIGPIHEIKKSAGTGTIEISEVDVGCYDENFPVAR
jgi:hypothetical protein